MKEGAEGSKYRTGRDLGFLRSTLGGEMLRVSESKRARVSAGIT